MQYRNGQLIIKFDDPTNGNAASGIEVTVTSESGGLATIYQNDDTSGPTLPNPLTTDSNGRYSYYAINGTYTESFSSQDADVIINLVDSLSGYVSYEFNTIENAKNGLTIGGEIVTLKEDDVIRIKESGSPQFDVVLNGGPANDLDVIQSTANPALFFVMRNNTKISAFSSGVGVGVKNGSQTNVGMEVNRDLETGDINSSAHGFNVSDYWAVDVFAFNPFGCDVQVGDGTQEASFDSDHVHSFQVTDTINLGLGTLSTHLGFVDTKLIQSGVVNRTQGFTAVDILGGRDTPGFSTPNFEVDGPAVVQNQTGVATLIKHGQNPRSIHCQAGNADDGTLLTSGGAPADFECPIIVRQTTESVSTLSGAVIVTDGGIGAAGNIFGTNEISVVGVAPLFRFRNNVNSEIGQLFHNGTDLLLNNSLNNNVKIGVNGSSVVEYASDRVVPTVNATLNSGDSTRRWIQSFVTIAENVSSDRNTKTEVNPIPEAALDAWGEVKTKVYKRKIAVEKKGDEARFHIGYIAQDIIEAFNNHGLNAFDYSLISSDFVTKEVKKTKPVERQVTEDKEVERETFEKVNGKLVRKVDKVIEKTPIYERLGVFNDDGTPFLIDTFEKVDTGKTDAKGRKIYRDEKIQIQLTKDVPLTEVIQEPYIDIVKTDEKTLSLRYSECMVLESAFLRRAILSK